MKIILVAILLFGGAALANSDTYEKLFKEGQYKEIINLIKVETKNDKDLIYLARSHYKLGNYKSAQDIFKIFLDLYESKENSPVIDYEYAQISYALNDLGAAKKYFNRSRWKKYKEIVSLYYLGVINHFEKKFHIAESNYDQVIDHRSTEKETLEVKQAAYAQRAEIRLYQAINSKKFQFELDEKNRLEALLVKSDKKDEIKKMVIPELEKGISLNKDSKTALGLKSRISELKKKYKLDVDEMVSGREIKNKKLFLRLNTIFGYDSNVVAISDEAQTQPLEKASMTGDVAAFVTRKFTYKHKWFFKPELRANVKHHFDRDVPEIHGNDQYSINPALRINYEHKMFNSPAHVIFDFDYNYTQRDRNQEKRHLFYSKAWGVTLGEQFKIWKKGETTFRFKYTNTSSYSAALDSTSMNFTLSQVYNRASGDKLIGILTTNFLDSETDLVDSASLGLITNYIWLPKNSWINFWTFGLSTTFTDTKELSSIRGTEINLSPSISATKIINKSIQATVNYSFNKNSSDDEANYGYSKHLATLNFGFNF